jgi:hypothetical protein
MVSGQLKHTHARISAEPDIVIYVPFMYVYMCIKRVYMLCALHKSLHACIFANKTHTHTHTDRHTFMYMKVSIVGVCMYKQMSDAWMHGCTYVSRYMFTHS